LIFLVESYFVVLVDRLDATARLTNTLLSAALRVAVTRVTIAMLMLQENTSALPRNVLSLFVWSATDSSVEISMAT